MALPKTRITESEENNHDLFGSWYEAINDPNNVGRYFNVYTQIALEETWKILEEHDIPVTPADFGFDNEALKK